MEISLREILEQLATACFWDGANRQRGNKDTYIARAEELITGMPPSEIYGEKDMQEILNNMESLE